MEATLQKLLSIFLTIWNAPNTMRTKKFFILATWWNVYHYSELESLSIKTLNLNSVNNDLCTTHNSINYCCFVFWLKFIVSLMAVFFYWFFRCFFFHERFQFKLRVQDINFLIWNFTYSFGLWLKLRNLYFQFFVNPFWTP